jgi:hypothetical protein
MCIRDSNNTWQDLTIRLLKTGDWRVIAKNEINSQQLLVLKGSQAESYMLD